MSRRVERSWPSGAGTREKGEGTRLRRETRGERGERCEASSRTADAACCRGWLRPRKVVLPAPGWAGQFRYKDEGISARGGGQGGVGRRRGASRGGGTGPPREGGRAAVGLRGRPQGELRRHPGQRRSGGPAGYQWSAFAPVRRPLFRTPPAPAGPRPAAPAGRRGRAAPPTGRCPARGTPSPPPPPRGRAGPSAPPRACRCCRSPARP